jgi:hypothetical protein
LRGRGLPAKAMRRRKKRHARLMCRAHNAYLAECGYGREAMARHRRPRSRASPAAVG